MHDLATKMIHLDAIEKAVTKVEAFTGRPNLFETSFVACLMALLFGLVAQCAANEIRVTAVVAFLTFLAIFFLYYHFGPAPSSEVEVLDDLLADYEPVDERSYAQLQASTRKALVLDTLEVGRWLQNERVSIQNHSSPPPLPASRFMNKVLRGS